MVVSTSLVWPETPCEALDLTNKPVIYIMVTEPRNQSSLHQYLAREGYIPFLLTNFGKDELWRFHHPDGPKPL